MCYNTSMNYREALAALKNDRLNHRLILEGQESYLVEDFLKKMKEYYALSSEGEINVLSVDAAEILNPGFFDFLFGLPLFSEHKLLIIRHAQSLKLDKSTWNEIAHIDPCTKVVFLCDNKSEAYKTIAAFSDVVVMKKITREEMEKWVVKQLRLSGKKISREVLTRLINYSGYFEFRSTTDLFFLKTEIEKLVATEEEVISLQRVDALLGRPMEEHIFNLIGFITQKDAKNALSTFDEYIKSGSNLYLILPMLSRSYHQMHMMRKLYEEGHPLPSIMDKIGLKSEYVVKKMLSNVKKLSSEQILSDLNNCLERERIYKSESVQVKAHLESLILELLQ